MSVQIGQAGGQQSSPLWRHPLFSPCLVCASAIAFRTRKATSPQAAPNKTSVGHWAEQIWTDLDHQADGWKCSCRYRQSRAPATSDLPNAMGHESARMMLSIERCRLQRMLPKSGNSLWKECRNINATPCGLNPTPSARNSRNILILLCKSTSIWCL